MNHTFLWGVSHPLPGSMTPWVNLSHAISQWTTSRREPPTVWDTSCSIVSSAALSVHPHVHTPTHTHTHTHTPSHTHTHTYFIARRIPPLNPTPPPLFLLPLAASPSLKPWLLASHSVSWLCSMQSGSVSLLPTFLRESQGSSTSPLASYSPTSLWVTLCVTLSCCYSHPLMWLWTVWVQQEHHLGRNLSSAICIPSLKQ